MRNAGGLSTSSTLSLPRQVNAHGTSVLYAQKPLGLDTAFVESLTSYLRRLGLRHAQHPSFLISELISQPFRKLTGQPFYAALSLTEALNGRVAYTPVVLAYLESLTWVPDVRRTAINDRVPGIYLERSACVVRHWCPDCLREDKEPYDRLVWSLKPYEACVVHDRAMASICGKCNRPHLPFQRRATATACPCGAPLSETQTASRAAGANERALTDLVSDHGSLCVSRRRTRPHHLEAGAIRRHPAAVDPPHESGSC